MRQRPPTLETLGWNESLKSSLSARFAGDIEPGRIAVEDKNHYVVFTADGALVAKISGKVLHQAASPADLPKVGDWVGLSALRNEGKAVIHGVLPRRTKLSRKVVGRETTEQVLVVNVDTVFIVQGLDRPFNPALLHRHLVMAREGGVRPVIVLNKADLCADVPARLALVAQASIDAPVIAVSAITGRALNALTKLIPPGDTVVFIGPSGVGKSTLINQLYGEELMATTEVRASDSKGRHTTSWRELIVLPGGGLVIDTPGTREFHLWMAADGAREAFADIDALALKCHFSNCGHALEKRCAVQAAVAAGELAKERLDEYFKLHEELTRLGESARQQRRLGRKGVGGAGRPARSTAWKRGD